MSSPLDRIEARWRKNAEIDPTQFDGPRRRIAELTLREAQDVLALVNIAKAAERLDNALVLTAPKSAQAWIRKLVPRKKLRKALAALNKEPA